MSNDQFKNMSDIEIEEQAASSAGGHFIQLHKDLLAERQRRLNQKYKENKRLQYILIILTTAILIVTVASLIVLLFK